MSISLKGSKIVIVLALLGVDFVEAFCNLHLLFSVRNQPSTEALLTTDCVARDESTCIGKRIPTTRRASSKSEADQSATQDAEETLLQMNLSIAVGADPDKALETVRAYVRSFPFAAVLPVQPLTYLPTEDGRGVKVTFLRKKTKEKGSVDGGLDFSIEFTSPGDEDVGSGAGRRIKIVAKRNSEGQTVNKMFSEKLIVLAFIKGVSGEDGARASDDLSSFVSMDSIFHKWM